MLEISDSLSVPYDSITYMISKSEWDHRALFNSVACRASDTLNQGTSEVALLIDESSYLKKGQSSVGVDRQYAGCIGKVDNCQILVHTALSSGPFRTLIDSRLYLPESWTDDPVRCEKAKIPEKDYQEYKTKPQIAMESIENQLSIGVKFDWVGGDGLYGDNAELLEKLEQKGIQFLFDVHCNQRIYLNDPEPELPEYKGRGRYPKHKKAKAEAIEVREYAEGLSDEAWTESLLRPSERGDIKVAWHVKEVWFWYGGEVHHWRVVMSKEWNKETEEYGEIKYSLTNVKETDCSGRRCVERQRQRYWIYRIMLV